jgi:thioredoxin-like negative regulator of GroEL
VTPKLRWAVLALLITAPAAALAQQQQGGARDAAHLSRARALFEKRRFEAALAIYDSLWRAEPGSREAALGRAQTLGLTGRLADALRAYEEWLDANQRDVGAVEKLAQTFEWAGRLNEAERLFKALAAGGFAEGPRGLARIAARRGDLGESQRRGRVVVDKDPPPAADPVPRAPSRPPAASPPAAASPTRTNAARRIHVEPVAEGMNDTDGNRVRMVGGTAAVATPWSGEFGVYARHRAAADDTTLASSIHASVIASQKLGPLSFRGSVGATRLADTTTTPAGPTRDVLTGAATLSLNLGGRARLVASGSRAAFDETAPLMRSGIISTTVGGGMSLDLGLGFGISTEVEQAQLSGATPNTRLGGSGSFSWRAPAFLSLATTVRAFGYTLDPGEGYFAPRQYLRAEANARIAVGRDRGLSVTLDGGAGAQSIDDVRTVLESPPRPLPHGGLSIRYRPTPRLDLSVSGTTSTAASAATSQLNSYRATAVSVRGRVSF